MTKKNIAVIGCGHWGKNLVRNFAQLGALASVTDGNADLAQKFADEYGVDNLTFDEVLGRSDVEGVVLATPAETHANLALQALASGKHAYVEKPLSLSLSDAEAMIAKAQQEGRVLMVGHLLQYHPVFCALRDMVQNGDLGKIRYLYSNRLSYGKLRSEENVFWSFAPHDISMILSLTGEEPDNIQAVYTDSVQDGLADFATAHMSFPSGVKAHIEVSWLNPFKEQKLVVVGQDAMAVFDDTQAWDQKLALYKHGIDFSGPVPVAVKAEPEYVDVPQGEPLKEECLHFIDRVSDGTAPRTDGEEGLRVLKVLQGCDAAAQSKVKKDLAA